MKNILNIDNGIPTLLSNVDDGTNTLYINDELVPSSEWTGTGYYTFTSGGLTFTIRKIRDTSGNIMLQLIEQSGGTSYRLIKAVSTDDKYYSIDDPAETDLADGDYVPFYDTSAGAKKKSLWSNVINKLKSIFVTSRDYPTNIRYGTTETTTNIKIKINSTERWMLCFTVTLYQGYRATKLMISGYNYGSNYWHEPKAVLLGDSTGVLDNSLMVYFGYDAVNELWVSFNGGNYTGVTISDVCNGYTQISDYSDLFTILNGGGGTAQYDVMPLSKCWNAYSAGHADSADSSVDAVNASYAASAGYADNAGKLSGYSADKSGTANTIVQRSGYGYINAGNSATENPASYTAYPVFQDSDGWYRKATKANYRSWLGILYISSTTLTSTVSSGTEANICKLTIPSSGTYIINGQAGFTSDCNSYAAFLLRQNSTNITKIGKDKVVNSDMFNATLVKTLSANDIIYIRIYQGSGSTKTVNNVYLSAIRIE